MSVALAYNPLNVPKAWITSPPFAAPVSDEELAAVQRDVDSIVGLTRGNKSIAKIVWNGDRRYWSEYFDEWNDLGRPTAPPKRKPHVLYKMVIDEHDRSLREIFVPRFILLTRLEPEQIAPFWTRDSKRYCSERRVHVQVRPEQVPADEYLWQYTVAEHSGFCCRAAGAAGEVCYGLYAHPRAVIPYLEERRKGLELAGIRQVDPFKVPDRDLIRYARASNSNYDDHAVRQFAAMTRETAAESPLVMVPDAMIEDPSVSRQKILDAAREEGERAIEAFERKIQQGRT